MLCRIIDANLYGARLQVDEAPSADSFYVIDLECNVAHKARVIWREAPFVGTRFVASWNLSRDIAPGWIKIAAATAMELQMRESVIMPWSKPDAGAPASPS